MRNDDRNWMLFLGSAWPGEDADAHEDVVAIEDCDRGVRYELVLAAEGGKTGVKRLAILPLRDGTLIDQDLLDRVPVRHLARQARDFLDGRLRNTPGHPLSVNTPRLTDRPPPELVARHWKNGWGREEISNHYRVSPKTADVWIRKARDGGLIPPATVGRPSTKPKEQPPRQEESE